MRGGGDLAFASWRWLAGQRLTAKELQEIKVTRNLADVGVGDMVAAVLAVGNLARAVGSSLIFFMDEMEEIQNVRQGDAADSWHQYTRKLADNSNSSVGFVLGFKADTLDDAPRVLYRPDVISRIGKQNLIELEMLGAPANVKTFVEDMLSQPLEVVVNEVRHSIAQIGFVAPRVNLFLSETELHFRCGQRRRVESVAHAKAVFTAPIGRVDFDDVPCLQLLHVIGVVASDEMLEVFGRDSLVQGGDLLGFDDNLADDEAVMNLKLFPQVLDMGLECGGDYECPLFHPPRPLSVWFCR